MPWPRPHGSVDSSGADHSHLHPNEPITGVRLPVASHPRLECSWRNMMTVWGADHTRGLCDTVCNVFEIARDEMPPHNLQGAYPQETRATADLRQQLMRTELLMFLDDGVSLLMAETFTGNGVAFAMNSASKAILCSDHEADDLLEKHKLLPIHLLACMLNPDDRECLLKPYFDLCSTARSNGCAVVKFCGRNGTTDLHILCWRYMELPGSPGSLTITFTLEKPVNTRHFTQGPGHGHLTVEQFARKGQNDTAQTAGVTQGII